MIASAGRRVIIDRMLGAALLDTETYQEAALVPSTRAQAALVVVISAVAAALGSLSGGFAGLVLGGLAAVFGWGLYVYAAFWAATRRFGVPGT
ncbi:MAG TPA: hypothetical protein VJ578_04380, partial [Dehalococcoidia bacterium]|nr:hypothetical protein [Dehalococcoidia bacterium]